MEDLFLCKLEDSTYTQGAVQGISLGEGGVIEMKPDQARFIML